MNAVAEAEVTPVTTLEEELLFQGIAIALIEPPKAAERDDQAASEKEVERRLRELTVREVDLSAFTSGEREIIEDFLTSHLSRAWRLPESGRTRSARFQPDSLIGGVFNRLGTPGRDDFLADSHRIARRLVKVTPSRASRGLLMVLLFQRADVDYLGLFKFDPGTHDSIYLKEDDAGQMLLELAARRVEYELPQPGDRVLKWAVIPHPTNEDFEIKLRDEQGDREPAFYFVDFLECRDYESGGWQAAQAIELVLQHSKEKRRLQAARTGTTQVATNASHSQEAVTLPTLLEWLQESGLVREAELEAFKERIRSSRAADLRAQPEVFKRLRLTYELSTGIKISGTLLEVLGQVKVQRSGSLYRFSFDSQDYEISVAQGR